MRKSSRPSSTSTRRGRTESLPAVAAPAKTGAARRRPTRSTNPDGGVPANGGARHHLIAEAAYFRAQQRGFDGDHALDDWLEAEFEIERRES